MRILPPTLGENAFQESLHVFMRKHTNAIGLSTAFCVALLIYNVPGEAQSAHIRSEERKSDTVEVESRNLYFRFSDRVAVDIRYLRGQMIPFRAGQPVTFDDVQSFEII